MLMGGVSKTMKVEEGYKKNHFIVETVIGKKTDTIYSRGNKNI